jgi:hypothetical protein
VRYYVSGASAPSVPDTKMCPLADWPPDSDLSAPDSMARRRELGDLEGAHRRVFADHEHVRDEFEWPLIHFTPALPDKLIEPVV